MDGKVVFITGAARGQGRAHALRLAEEGADIIAVDISKPVPGVGYEAATAEDLAETVRQVEALDRRIVAEQADVRDFARLKEVVDKGVAELGGRLDGVVANAGIDFGRSWDDFTEEEFRTIVDINLIGVWNTARVSAPSMVEAGNGGSIVLVSSANGLKGGPFNAAYVSSKFGVTGLGKVLAAELSKDRIRVNTLHPGGVATHMGSIFPEFEAAAARSSNEHLMATYGQFSPGGAVDAREMAHAVLFMLSDESTYMMGHAMAVDGGMTQW